jgi:hypothetical protein
MGAVHAGLLWGRITTTDGATYEGRIRFGGTEEALWGHQFNGFQDKNRWVDDAPRSELPKERLSVEVLGINISGPGARYPLGRPFMARFGDISRIEPTHRAIRVTLKSGTTFELDRYAADDLADGIRVWDATHGVIDLGEGRIQSIEFLPTPASDAGGGSAPLHGTVRTAHGSFTGLLQWDREEGLGSDLFEGQGATGAVSLRYDTIRSIERVGADRSRVTTLDGQVQELSGTRNAGVLNRGVYVDDPRYGRVLVSWETFEQVDFTPDATAPAYTDFAAGGPLVGTVVTRSGRRLTGRLVYDLDESETTETLDAPSQGVDYTIPFGLISAIGSRGTNGAAITLRSGEVLELDAAGDLGPQNGGMLIFVEGAAQAEYVPWNEVLRVDLDRPSAA